MKGTPKPVDNHQPFDVTKDKTNSPLTITVMTRRCSRQFVVSVQSAWRR